MRIQLPIEKNIRWKYKMSSRFSSKKSRRTIYWLLRSALSFEYNAKISCTKHNFVCELLHLFSLFFFSAKKKENIFTFYIVFGTWPKRTETMQKNMFARVQFLFFSCNFSVSSCFILASLYQCKNISTMLLIRDITYLVCFFSVFFFSSWNFFQLLLTIIACVKQRKLHFFSFISFCFFFLLLISIHNCHWMCKQNNWRWMHVESFDIFFSIVFFSYSL